MSLLRSFVILLFLAAIVISCSTGEQSSESSNDVRVAVEMKTDYGDIVIELYNETPLHRDNFIELANEGAYDSLLFHRVIENFMIQGGDPDSKYAEPGAPLGSGGRDYRVDAEFRNNLFHKKGVLAAARDGNLQRASSSMQFYIVQGRVYNDSLLAQDENRINTWLAEHYFKNDPANKALIDALQQARENEDFESYRMYSDSISSQASTYTNFERYTIPEDHREVYKSIGGTPFLDQNYTVYGEVIEGLAVVDSIAAVQTSPRNRPVADVRIQSVRVIEQ